MKLLLIKLLFLHFGRYLLIGTMDFWTAFIIQKHLDGIFFSYIIDEVPAASLEKIKDVSLFFLSIFLGNILFLVGKRKKCMENSDVCLTKGGGGDSMMSYIGINIISKWIPEEKEIPGIIFRKLIPDKKSQENPSKILSWRKRKEIPENPKVNASKRDKRTVLDHLKQETNVLQHQNNKLIYPFLYLGELNK